MAQPPSLLTTDNGLPFGVQGACDSRFTGVIRAFAGLYPGRKFGGGALSVYIDGRQVVDVWTGWSDRQGKVPWTADTGAMVFSATKGLAATVIHRLVDRGLLSYDAPVAEYWPEFGANGKSEVTVSDVLRHRSGLAHLKGVDKDEVMDHLLMEQKLAAAPLDRQHGKLAYHAVTYGWLLSGLARAVTGKGMRELFREELARPLNTEWYSSRPATGRLAYQGGTDTSAPSQGPHPTARFHRTKGCGAVVLRAARRRLLPGHPVVAARRYAVPRR